MSRCSTSWCSSDTNWSLCRPHRLRLSPTRSSSSISEAGCESQLITCASDSLPINLRFLQLPLQVLWFVSTGHRIQGETYLHLLAYHIMKEMKKDTNEQRHEEIHRVVRSGRICPCGVGVHQPLGTWICFNQCRNSPNLILLEFLWRLPSGRQDWLLTQSPVPIPSCS